jgi:hypothetical protein
VLCLGEFPTDATITIPSYTTFAVQGKLTWTGADDLASFMLDSTGDHIDLVGGAYDGGNKAGEVFSFVGADDLHVTGTYLTNVKALGAFGVLWNCDNAVLSGNYVYGNEQGLGFDLYDGCSNVSVANNVFYKPYDSAISIGSSGGVLCTNISVTGNTVIGYTSGNGMGISCFGLASHITITGNTITDQTFDGVNAIIDVNTPDSILITGNVIDGCQRHGINVEGTNSAVTGNIVRDAATYGIHAAGANLLVTGNYVRGCTSAGIYVYVNTDDVVVTGNQSRYNDYGVVIAATCDRTLVTDNNLLNNTTANLSDGGTASVIRHNQGWVTEASGVTGAIASGTAVNHGLAATPKSVRVTAAESGPTDVYVTEVGAASFKINFGGGGNKTFYWDAEVY